MNEEKFIAACKEFESQCKLFKETTGVDVIVTLTSEENVKSNIDPLFAWTSTIDNKEVISDLMNLSLIAVEEDLGREA